MKRSSSLFWCIILISCTRFSQVSNFPPIEINSPVHVKDWGKMKMMIGNDIWNNAENEIISQIGKDEYTVVKKKYDYKSLPLEMSLFNLENRKNVTKYYEKLSNLKLFRIAGFAVNSNGKDLGRNAILKVPYKGNEKWDMNVKWDSVYFVINEEAIEIK